MSMFLNVFSFSQLFPGKKKRNTKKHQTFLTSCDLVFNVKLKELLKIFLPAVISNNVIEKTCAYFSCASFTTSELWILYKKIMLSYSL